LERLVPKKINQLCHFRPVLRFMRGAFYLQKGVKHKEEDEREERY